MGHYGPMSSAIEMKVAEKEKAVTRRGAELASKPKMYVKGMVFFVALFCS